MTTPNKSPRIPFGPDHDPQDDMVDRTQLPYSQVRKRYGIPEPKDDVSFAGMAVLRGTAELSDATRAAQDEIREQQHLTGSTPLSAEQLATNQRGFELVRKALEDAHNAGKPVA